MDSSHKKKKKKKKSPVRNVSSHSSEKSADEKSKTSPNKSKKNKKIKKETKDSENEKPLEKKLQSRIKNLEKGKAQPKQTTKTTTKESSKQVTKTKDPIPSKKDKTKKTVAPDVKGKDGKKGSLSKTKEKEKVGGKDPNAKRPLKVIEEDSTKDSTALRDKLKDSLVIVKEKIPKQKNVSDKIKPGKKRRGDETPLLTVVEESKIRKPRYTGICFEDVPVRLTCYNCQQNILTEVVLVPGRKTYVISAIICAFVGWIGCQVVPFCTESCLDVAHVCPICDQELGRVPKWT